MRNKKNVLLWDKFMNVVSNPKVITMRNKKNLLLAFFLLALAAGLYYPVSKIIRFEFPWVPPVTVRFAAEIYDPYDPFRGRYVAISANNLTMSVEDAGSRPALDRDSRLYAVIELDEKGVAKLVDVAEKPQSGKINLRLERYAVYSRRRDVDGVTGETYTARLPFNRFYMNEKLAPEAERAFIRAVRSRESGKCQIVVKIYADGRHAIENLEIEGMPIHEFLRKKQTEKEETDITELSEQTAGRGMSIEEEIDINKEGADIAELHKKDEASDIIFAPD